MTEETIFAEALERSTPVERAAYLDEACAGDAVLRQRVETLLESHEAGGDFLGKPAIQCAAEELAGQACGEDTQGELPADGGDVAALDFLAPSDKPGSLGRLGHYEVQEVVGRGGMGVVLRAFDEKLHRVVAVKVMAPQLATSATARKRFAREARAAAAVRNEYVVGIHAVEDGAPLPYLVMEYVTGPSLQERFDRGGPLGVAEILRIGMQAAAGLAAAHAQGLIHRDVKPANILLENGVERVKITDFGLARAVDDASLTQSGVVAGTPQYMAPEQARGEAVDPRADLFSLGSVLYATCTGRPPFRASGTMAVLKRVCEEEPRPIREVNPETPDWLVAIIAKLQSKNPADRFQSATEVAELLGQHLAHLQHPQTVPRPKAAPPARRRHWRVPVAVVLCLVGVLVLAEAVGVTKIRATVARAFARDGTPVVPEGAQGREAVGQTLAPDEIRRFVGLTGTPNGVAFSPDGRLVMAGNGGRYKDGKFGDPPDHTVRLWDVETGQEKRCLPQGNASVSSLAFSPIDKRIFVAGLGLGVRCWDRETGQKLGGYEDSPGVIWSVAVSRDGRSAVCGGPGAGPVHLWDVETGKTIHLLEWGTGQTRPEGQRDHVVWTVAFSADGSRVAAGGMYYEKVGAKVVEKYAIHVWDVKDGKVVRVLQGHTDMVKSLVFSPDSSRLLSGSFDGTVRLWEVETGRLVRIVGRHQGLVEGVALSPDGRRALSAGWQDKTVRLWDVETGRELPSLPHPAETWSVAFSLDGQRALTGCTDGIVRLWQLPEFVAAPPADQPFVLLGGKGIQVGKFDTLAAAVRDANNGDAIEVRGDGPFVSPPIDLGTRALAIRAGGGCRPVIRMSPEGLRTNVPLLTTHGPLVLEGLEFQRLGQLALPGPISIVSSDGTALHVGNCRFLTDPGFYLCCVYSVSARCIIRNCEFLTPFGRSVWEVFPFNQGYVLDNCLHIGAVSAHWDYHGHGSDSCIRLNRNTFVLSDVAVSCDVRSVPGQVKGSRPVTPVKIDVSGTIFDCPNALRFVAFQGRLPSKMVDQPDKVDGLLRRTLVWQDRENVYGGDGPVMSWVVEKGMTPPTTANSLQDWRQFWGAADDAACVGGRVRYQGGNLFAKLAEAPQQLQPEDFRLRRDSAGYRAGKDGKDLGADVDLVGPGPAYERWKKTPAYQQWLRDTGQVKK